MVENTPQDVDEKEIAIVGRLLKTCNERISGFTKASLEINDPELKEVCLQFALQTEGFTKQLLEFIKEKRSMHQETGRLSEIWEAWMDLRSTITHGSRNAILDVCMTGEKAAIKTYINALEDATSLILKQIISGQLEQIENTFNNIRQIKSKL